MQSAQIAWVLRRQEPRLRMTNLDSPPTEIRPRSGQLVTAVPRVEFALGASFLVAKKISLWFDRIEHFEIYVFAFLGLPKFNNECLIASTYPGIVHSSLHDGITISIHDADAD
jgi:hypothetical protein